MNAVTIKINTGTSKKQYAATTATLKGTAECGAAGGVLEKVKALLPKTSRAPALPKSAPLPPALEPEQQPSRQAAPPHAPLEKELHAL
jgi:hypothetical protein